MDNGSVADAVIANRGLNFAGNGYGYGGHGNFHGDGSAVNANVVANRDLGVMGAINQNSTDQFLSDRITSGDSAIKDAINVSNQFLSDRIWSQGIDAKFAAVTAQFASSERLAFANQANTDRELKAIQLKQVECCCETKAGLAAISAKLDADRAASAENEVNNLRLQLNIVNQGRGNSGNG